MCEYFISLLPQNIVIYYQQHNSKFETRFSHFPTRNKQQIEIHACIFAQALYF